MAPSTTHTLLRLCDSFYLPVISIALLTGFTASITIPAVLGLLFPASDATAFVSLPLHHLWKSLISWLTPPCLFVLLNGIIVVLTATSGMFTSSIMSGDERDFDTHLLKAMEDAQNFQSSVSPRGTESLVGECGPVSSHAHGIRNKAEDDDRLLVNEDDDEEDDDRSFVNKDHGQEDGDDHDEDDDNYEDAEEEEMPSRMLRVCVASNNFLLKENRHLGPAMHKHDRVMGGSEPSSPQFVMAAKSSSIKRSLSIDSAPFHDNQPIPSVEQLSDEAFKKRVEDFIAKMNAQLRSGPK